MENEIDQVTMWIMYEEAKRNLWQKAGIFSLCLILFGVMFKLTMEGASFLEVLSSAFFMAVTFYIPFKVAFKMTGSVILGFLGSFLLIMIIGLLSGENGVLTAIILLGGFALDFGSSIWAVLKNRPSQRIVKSI